MDKDDHVFKTTTFSDVMSDVYHNSKKKDRQISKLIEQLQPLIRKASDAMVIVPLIKEYLDISVKNDDHLIKLAAIIQRYISTKQTLEGSDGLFSDDEKEQLLEIAKKSYVEESEEVLADIQNEEEKIREKIEEAKDKLKDNENGR
jgi:hypothetical protein